MHCFAVVVPGMEDVARDELMDLAVHDVATVDGGVSFQASPDGLARVNLRSRTLTRVLVRLAKFKALSFPELFNKSRKIDWQRYISSGSKINIRASCHQSRLMHSGRVEKAVLDGMASRLGVDLTSAAVKEHEQLIAVRIVKDECVISLDSSGERLDRRGYRIHSGRAPIRETLAAGIIRWMNWQPNEPLLVPMCGSGTFAIEAALIGQCRAANIGHDFAMLHWPLLNQKRWQRVLEKTTAMEKSRRLNIQASDIDAGMLKQAYANAEQAGVAEEISFYQQDVRQLRSRGDGAGLVICNPPYGGRIKGDITTLYRSLGHALKQSFKGWRAAVIVPDKACENALNLRSERRLKIKHGGKWVYVLAFDLD